MKGMTLIAALAGSVVTAGAAAATSYSAEQTAVCAPQLVTDNGGQAKKSHVGQSVTATAISVVNAPEGYFLDARPSAVDYKQSGTHLNRPGTPNVTQRANGFLPLTIELKSQAHRGSSFRTGRNAAAYNPLAVFAVKKSAVCLEALGLI